MNLNHLKVISLAVLLVLAGCNARPVDSIETEETRSDTTSTSTSPTLSPTTTPERPQELTETNVVQFVSKLAEARTHNRLLRDDVVDVSVNCDASLRATSATGYFLETVCRGYADYENVHVDLGITPTAYFVSDDEIRWINSSFTAIRSSDELFSSNNSSRNFAPPYQPAEIRIYNFDSSQHDVSITVQYVGDSRGENVDSRSENATTAEYEIGEMEGIIQDKVTIQRGEYEVIVRVDGTRTGRYSWNVTEPSKTPVFSIYVSPRGDVLVSV